MAEHVRRVRDENPRRTRKSGTLRSSAFVVVVVSAFRVCRFLWCLLYPSTSLGPLPIPLSRTPSGEKWGHLPKHRPSRWLRQHLPRAVLHFPTILGRTKSRYPNTLEKTQNSTSQRSGSRTPSASWPRRSCSSPPAAGFPRPPKTSWTTLSNEWFHLSHEIRGRKLSGSSSRSTTRRTGGRARPRSSTRGRRST